MRPQTGVPDESGTGRRRLSPATPKTPDVETGQLDVAEQDPLDRPQVKSEQAFVVAGRDETDARQRSRSRHAASLDAEPTRGPVCAAEAADEQRSAPELRA